MLVHATGVVGRGTIIGVVRPQERVRYKGSPPFPCSSDVAVGGALVVDRQRRSALPCTEGCLDTLTVSLVDGGDGAAGDFTECHIELTHRDQLEGRGGGSRSGTRRGTGGCCPASLLVCAMRIGRAHTDSLDACT